MAAFQQTARDIQGDAERLNKDLCVYRVCWGVWASLRRGAGGSSSPCSWEIHHKGLPGMLQRLQEVLLLRTV